VELIADMLLVAGALGASLYCVILSRRLRRFADVESGVGGAIAALSAQVEQMTEALGSAQQTAGASTRSLETLTGRAEEVARRLELLVASMHDLPDAPPATQDAAPRPAAAVFHSRRPFPEAAE
jgi:ABC-type transporter Mla subunit MlaD